MEWGITKALPCVLGACALTRGRGAVNCSILHAFLVALGMYPYVGTSLGCVGHTLLFPPMHAMSCEYPELFSAGTVVLYFVGGMS